MRKRRRRKRRKRRRKTSRERKEEGKRGRERRKERKKRWKREEEGKGKRGRETEKEREGEERRERERRGENRESNTRNVPPSPDAFPSTKLGNNITPTKGRLGKNITPIGRCDSCHSRVIQNQQYLYPKFPPTAVAKLLQYSGLASNTGMGFRLTNDLYNDSK